MKNNSRNNEQNETNSIKFVQLVSINDDIKTGFSEKEQEFLSLKESGLMAEKKHFSGVIN